MKFAEYISLRERAVPIGFTGFYYDYPQNVGVYQKVRSKYVEQDPTERQTEKKEKMKPTPRERYGIIKKSRNFLDTK